PVPVDPLALPEPDEDRVGWPEREARPHPTVAAPPLDDLADLRARDRLAGDVDPERVPVDLLRAAVALDACVGSLAARGNSKQNNGETDRGDQRTRAPLRLQISPHRLVSLRGLIG